MKTTEYLDAVRAKHGIQSDYKLAQILDLTKAAVSLYRSKGVTLSDEVALRVAELLGVPPGRILADMQAERAKTDATRSAWRKVADSIAACLVGAVILAGLGAPAPSHAAVHNAERLCIMSNVRNLRNYLKFASRRLLKILSPRKAALAFSA